MADSSFSCGQRCKFEEIAQGTAEHMDMAEATPEDVLRAACREHTIGRVLALDIIQQRELNRTELRNGGMERLDITRSFKGRCNYANVYQWSDKAATLRMVDAWGRTACRKRRTRLVGTGGAGLGG